jgi:serine protease Do
MNRQIHRTLRAAFNLNPTIRGVAACVLLLALRQPLFAEWDPGVLGKVLEKAEGTLVTVECVSRFEGSGQSREIPREVSGMVVSPTGLVMVQRNMEVIESSNRSFSLSRPDKVQIVFQNRERFEGSYIGVDSDLSVSFFRVEPEGTEPLSFPCLEFATGELELAGEVVSVRLLPEEYEPRLEVGSARVSAVLEKPRKLYRTQPTLTHFNGFPAFLPSGQVVGIITTEEDNGGAEDALSLLSGSVSVRPVGLYLNLIANPPVKPEKGWLGIRMEPVRRDLAEIWDLPGEGGIIVTETIRGSPAEASGLRSEDVIVAIDDRPLRVNSFADLGWFRQQVRNLKPNDSIKMEVVRGAATFGREAVEKKEITVTLGLAPPSETEAETITLPEIGLKVQELTLDLLWTKRLPQSQEGVVARYVERAGPADIGKVEEDDIILSIDSQLTKDLQAAKAVFDDLRGTKPKEVILHVLRDHSRLFLKVTPDWE